ncbi:DNA-binding MarR family transcriptional regulator [Cryobacterium mesophilum]|nr:MarR family transcriptional regulator [Terrimesophilobacter mesophilus]MBB5633618.1 DNA-binding MarR family transcriptional regulator [Terrimesophilobacter mesophilus]
MREETADTPSTIDPMIDPRYIDPDQVLIPRGGMDPAELEAVISVLSAVRRWREAEERMSEESRRQMHLGDNDMKAMRFIIVSTNWGTSATPGMIAEHLGISTASTTKLLDRLAAAGHITRTPHPADRRAIVITVNERAHDEVQERVGRLHARRFQVAAKLAPEEREVVIRFLDDLSATGTVEAGTVETGTVETGDVD